MTIKEYLSGGVWYNGELGQYVFRGTPNNAGMVTQLPDLGDLCGDKVTQVRGYGAIQNLFTTPQAAMDFQDELGKFIADAINEKLERM